MEKLVYLLWKEEAVDIPTFRKRLLDEQVPRLLELGTPGLTVNIADLDAELAGTVPIRKDSATVCGTVGFWIDCVDHRLPFEEQLRAVSPRIAGYLVTESIPLEYDERTWPDGERSPGVKLLTLFEKPEHLSTPEFIERWHGSHTPLSLEIHPMWRYVRNVVARSLTEEAPDFRGIVEEQFRTAEDLTDPARFYGSAETMKRNMRRVLEDCQRFLDLERIETYVMSEYIVKS